MRFDFKASIRIAVLLLALVIALYWLWMDRMAEKLPTSRGSVSYCDEVPFAPELELCRRMQDIVSSKEMPKAEKIAKLRAFLKPVSPCTMVLYRIAQVDAEAARNIALELFRANGTSRERKLEVGRILIQDRKATPFIPAADFVDEYAKFLINAVLSGGKNEFCAIHVEHQMTAVGEYAFIASDFEGHSSNNFRAIWDKRVIPILIRCFDAPDTVYGRQQGCVVMGKPGESTKRNVARQQIPVALAKLRAIQAIEPMTRLLKRHHDIYLRMNAAYALGFLTSGEKQKEIEQIS